MSETVSLQDVCEAIVDCEHKTAPEDPNGMYFAVGTPSMKGNQIDYSQARRISEETFAKWTRRLSPEIGDLLLAREAPVGPVVRIPQNLNVAPGQRTVLIRPNSTEVNAEYLYYLLSSPIQQAALLRYAEGSTVPHLNVSDVRSFALPRLPGLVEQRAIAEVLGALDDKIAANEKAIGAADQLALAALEAGVGTETTSLGELAQVTMGTSPSGDTFNEDGVGEPFFQGVRDFGMRSPVVRVWTTKPVRTASIGDVLLSVRAPVGRLNRAHKDLAIGRGLAAVRAFDGDNDLLYYRLRLAEGEWQSFSGDGTLFSSVNRKQIEGIKLRDLSDSSVREVVSSVEGSLRSALDESALLARTRDELLPLLMSGKITVKDAEAVVSDAV